MTTLTGYVPTLPEEYIDALTDTGRWREVGITHWHLWQHEDNTYNPQRYEKEIVAGHIARGEPCHDPREALRWIYLCHLAALISGPDPARYAHRKGWHDAAAFRFAIANSWEYMTAKPDLMTPIGGGLEVRAGRSLSVYAEPMTKARCLRHN